MKISPFRILAYLFAAFALLSPSKPVAEDYWVFGVVASQLDNPQSEGSAFVLGVEVALESWNLRGGVLGKKFKLEAADDGGNAKGATQAVETVQQKGAIGIIGPTRSALVAPVRDAASKAKAWVLSGVPPAGEAPLRPGLRSFAASPEAAAMFAENFVTEKLCVTRIGLLVDRSASGKAFAKTFKSKLKHPHAVVFEEDASTPPKALVKGLEEKQVQILVIDAGSEVVTALQNAAARGQRFPMLLTARAYSNAPTAYEGDVLVLLSRAPSTFAAAGPVFAGYRKRFGEPILAAAEGFDCANVFAKAIESAGGVDFAALEKAFTTVRTDGPRGSAGFAADGFASDARLGIWRVRNHTLEPHFPEPLLEGKSAGTTSVKPDASLGDPFGTHRTDKIGLEQDTQWVLFSYGTPKESTIDQDLKLLGLSTGGVSPLVDHLIREELLARVLAFTSTKFLRNEDGSSIPGKSLAISLATHLPAGAKNPGRAWTVVIAGDHAAAGGEAFPGQGRANIYCTFIRRTIFQPHALTPPVSAEDLCYLDHSYTFGEDPKRDKRSELIRALINGYAGSMALTTAHELGHVCGLDHDTDDPTGIMNVAEGAGIDHRFGHFTPGNIAALEKRLHKVKEPK